ncbi:hypothetical protein [Hymenobacter wooponensis]|uniref:Uncharacterized protein n=1 Tax=Hymenobacter wooponensis TaxID=1525360 RepID=A0A4Z0MN74_9BACT|nr:hypothetical protein [Hymenobacter wooponensis]TGD80758.1 hypothetical protein EU557_13175 [Hymenobacter wooponensis]
MANPIEVNANKVLVALFENNPNENLAFDGKDLVGFTSLDAKDINNAVDYLDSQGYLERLNYLGTAPFRFGHVSLNTQGKHFYYIWTAKSQPLPGKAK